MRVAEFGKLTSGRSISAAEFGGGRVVAASAAGSKTIGAGIARSGGENEVRSQNKEEEADEDHLDL